ncbi:F-actin capping protein beta subunit [Neoconidiobolus thromboides FSU 785]|nr:F-actin capping protein beta subunit [Neoconidiobolus thromboides FSU 785]
MEEYKPIECAIDLMRRMPPQKLELNLENLCDLLPEYSDTFYENIEKPLGISLCKKTGKEYLLSEFNRDGDSYRSPWSNEYEPEIATDIYPSSALRSLEVAFNDAFQVYTKLYYEGGISSVYLWEHKKGFNGTILIKKINDNNKRVRGAWDSIHIFEADLNGSHVVYRLSSSILLYTITNNSNVGTLNLSGSIRRMSEIESSVTQMNDHIINLGQLIEEQESKIRNTLHEVYFQKTKDIINEIRQLSNLNEQQNQSNLRHSLASKLQSMSLQKGEKSDAIDYTD